MKKRVFALCLLFGGLLIGSNAFADIVYQHKDGVWYACHQVNYDDTGEYEVHCVPIDYDPGPQPE